MAPVGVPEDDDAAGRGVPDEEPLWAEASDEEADEEEESD
jgi:hypothetical protein